MGKKSSFMLFIHFDYGRKMLTACHRSVAISIVSMADEERQPLPVLLATLADKSQTHKTILKFFKVSKLKFKMYKNNMKYSDQK